MNCPANETPAIKRKRRNRMPYSNVLFLRWTPTCPASDNAALCTGPPSNAKPRIGQPQTFGAAPEGSVGYYAANCRPGCPRTPGPKWCNSLSDDAQQGSGANLPYRFCKKARLGYVDHKLCLAAPHGREFVDRANLVGESQTFRIGRARSHGYASAREDDNPGSIR